MRNPAIATIMRLFVSMVVGVALTIGLYFLLEELFLYLFSSRYQPSAMSHSWDMPMVFSFPVVCIIMGYIIWRVYPQKKSN